MTTTTSSSSTTTYDPVTTAQQLATAYTSDRQTQLTQQTKDAAATAAGLTKLQSALSSFETALTALSDKKGVAAYSTTFSDTSVASATTTSAATPGSYTFFVQQLASANQVSYSGLTSTAVSSGDMLNVHIGDGSAGSTTTSFDIDLAAADTNADGKLTAKEIATAINAATGNGSTVIASTITVAGQSQLILQSTATGAASKITLTASGANAASQGLRDALNTGKELAAAQDAIVKLGDEATGVVLKQASNTYNAIDGVSITFNKAMASGTAPIKVTVTNDTSTTAANVQSFIDAYNSLQSVLTSLTSVGDPSKSVAAAVFANDSGLTAIASHLGTAVRESIGGVSLTSYGITTNRDGTLSLNQTTLAKKLAVNRDGINTLFGSTATGAQSGVLGDISKYVKLWTNSASGQIVTRQNSVNKLQSSLTDGQTKLDAIYNSAYARYLKQFTTLQTLQAQMAQTTNMFDAIFSNSSSS